MFLAPVFVLPTDPKETATGRTLNTNTQGQPAGDSSRTPFAGEYAVEVTAPDDEINAWRREIVHLCWHMRWVATLRTGCDRLPSGAPRPALPRANPSSVF